MFSKKTLLCMWSVIFLLTVWPMTARADTQSQLNEVRQQIQQHKKTLNEIRGQERGITGEINQIAKNIIVVEQEIQRLEGRIQKLTQAIIVNEAELRELEAKLAEQMGIMSERLVFIYEHGDTTYLEVVLAATDMKEFLTNYEFMSNIVDQDKATIQKIAEQKAEVERRRAQLVAQEAELQRARANQEQQRAALAAQQEAKKTALHKVENDRQAQEQALNELEATSRQLESVIRQAQASNASSSNPPKGSGQLGWPCDARNITSPFGMRYHPILKKNKLHTGTDFGASNGSNIYAADNGVVISSGWMGGYGKAVIVDHGKGISTLYAHQSSILVSNGQTVNKGQVIGKVGSTGWSTGAHLHFEVRVNGVPKNPMNYL